MLSVKASFAGLQRCSLRTLRRRTRARSCIPGVDNRLNVTYMIFFMFLTVFLIATLHALCSTIYREQQPIWRLL